MKEEDTKLHDNDAAAHPPVRLKYEKYTRTPLSRASCVSLLFTSILRTLKCKIYFGGGGGGGTPMTGVLPVRPGGGGGGMPIIIPPIGKPPIPTPMC